MSEKQKIFPRRRKCDCGKCPAYNFEGNTPHFCARCALKGMVDVKNKKCEYKDEGGVKCKLKPNFNYEGQDRGIYCKNHSKENMVDVKHKKCEYKDEKGIQCKTRPSYNFKGKKPRYCKEHSKKDMVDVLSKICEYNDNNGTICRIRPHFNYEGEKPKFCVKHKEKNMVDVSHKVCNICCAIRARPDGLICARCDPTKHRGEKELEVFDYLIDEFGWRFPTIHDKQNDDITECSGKRYRPDILMDCDSFFIDTEVDEYQHLHKKYHPENDDEYENYCEDIRMVNIAQSLSGTEEGMPCVFIRYNPDSFKRDEETVRCLKKDRLKILKQLIDDLLENPPTKPITVYQLFYDSPSKEDSYIQKYKIPYELISDALDNGKEEEVD